MNKPFAIFIVTLLCPAASWAQDYWTPTSTEGAPATRTDHVAVWTGQEMIVWGGSSTYYLPTNSGAKYDPLTNSWAAISLFGAPQARYDATAVWTGKEMIVWGGHDSSNHVNSGGRYDPLTDTWTPMSTLGAPSGRAEHTAVWTGQEMIVWSGYEFMESGVCGVSASNTTNTGGRYDPQTDTWIPLTTTGAPIARSYHAAVWTGQEMIVWGGVDGTAIPTANGFMYSNNFLASGARYHPPTDSWTALTNLGPPPGSTHPVAVWTGSEMVVWGGTGASGLVNTGGRYSPELDTWTLLPTLGAPSSRHAHRAVWTGQEMIVWGGSHSGYEGDGAKYSVENDSWVATLADGAPSGRHSHTAVWTGSQMIVWGGTTNSDPIGAGGIYGVDATPPLAGIVGSRIDFGSVSATWTGFEDPESRVTKYDWAIGTTPGATDVIPFTEVGSATTASAEGLALSPGVSYYVTVRATNGAGTSVTSTGDAVVAVGASSTKARCSASASSPGPLVGALALILLLAWLGHRRAG